MQEDLTVATGNHTPGTSNVREKFSFSRILTVGKPWSTSVVYQQDLSPGWIHNRAPEGVFLFLAAACLQ
jgi:hypothetical protein